MASPIRRRRFRRSRLPRVPPTTRLARVREGGYRDQPGPVGHSPLAESGLYTFKKYGAGGGYWLESVRAHQLFDLSGPGRWPKGGLGGDRAAEPP
jgi:hypothetical protein